MKNGTPESLRTPVAIDRMQSAFSDIAPYGTDLRYQMNCYGYALHVFNMTIGNASNPYKQQPGEFIQVSDGNSGIAYYVLYYTH